MIITDIEKLRVDSEAASEDDAVRIIKELEHNLELSEKYGNPGIGLAAPQIGISKKVAIVRINDIKINLVNCRVASEYDKIILPEGCLSLPGRSCEVERARQIIVDGNSYGSDAKFCAYGLVSSCVQHEMDHWKGILIIDKEKKKELNIGPNQPCPCGAKDKKGKFIKYKKCCGRKK